MAAAVEPGAKKPPPYGKMDVSFLDTSSMASKSLNPHDTFADGSTRLQRSLEEGVRSDAQTRAFLAMPSSPRRQEAWDNRNLTGHTLIHALIRGRHDPDEVDELLLVDLMRRGASINQGCRKYGTTPLIEAAQHAPAWVPVLLAHGADPLAYSRHSGSALSGMMHQLIASLSHTEEDEDEETDLHQAYLTAFEHLLPSVAAYYPVEGEEWTAVHWALSYAFQSDPSASFGARDSFGPRRAFDRELLERLLEAGAAVNSTNNQFSTPLSMWVDGATGCSSAEEKAHACAILEALLQAGARPVDEALPSPHHQPWNHVIDWLTDSRSCNADLALVAAQRMYRAGASLNALNASGNPLSSQCSPELLARIVSLEELEAAIAQGEAERPSSPVPAETRRKPRL